MNAIFGLFQCDNVPVLPATMDTLRQSAEVWGGGRERAKNPHRLSNRRGFCFLGVKKSTLRP